MENLIEMKIPFPLEGSPSGMEHYDGLPNVTEKYAGEPIRTVDGKAQAARYFVDGWYVFDDHDLKTEINRYKHRNNGKEPEIVEIDEVKINVTENIKYATADEAREHLKGNIPESLIIPYLKEQLQATESWLAAALTKLDEVDAVNATLAEKVEALEVKTAEPIKEADEPTTK